MQNRGPKSGRSQATRDPCFSSNETFRKPRTRTRSPCGQRTLADSVRLLLGVRAPAAAAKPPVEGIAWRVEGGQIPDKWFMVSPQARDQRDASLLLTLRPLAPAAHSGSLSGTRTSGITVDDGIRRSQLSWSLRARQSFLRGALIVLPSSSTSPVSDCHAMLPQTPFRIQSTGDRIMENQLKRKRERKITAARDRKRLVP